MQDKELIKKYREYKKIDFASMPYKKQLDAKQKFLSWLFCQDITIARSPKTKYYRTKMDYVYAMGKFGQRKPGSYKHVIEIESCDMISEKISKFIPRMRSLLHKHKIESHDYIKHEGYLRYVVIRHAKFTDQYMINFVTFTDENKLNKLVKEIYDEFDSIVWSYQPSLADLSYGKVLKWWKKPYIEEKFDNVVFRIGANMFFQSNSYVAREIYCRIKELVGMSGKARVLDLYAGAATISCYIANTCKEVTAVELNEEAAEFGRQNIEINKLDNVEIICEDTKEYLKKLEKLEHDTVIVDPPRAGMQKAAKYLVRLKPEKIVYMSCNPITLKQDLEVLGQNYTISVLEAYDMFPNTYHVEMLVLLESK